MFELEPRYLVLKISDLPSNADELPLNDVCFMHDLVRTARGATYLDCIVVEKDWPEYDAVLEMLKKRVNNET